MSKNVLKQELPFLFTPAEKLVSANLHDVKSETAVERSRAYEFGDELLEESDSLNILFELLGDQVNQLARVLGNQVVREGIKDKLTLVTAVCASFVTGGITQFLTEQPTAYVNGKVIEKFSSGIDFKEEMLEGGLPLVAGILLGEMGYKIAIAKGVKPEQGARSMMWVLGTVLGWSGMFWAGDLAHQLLNVPDLDVLKLLGG